MAAMHVSDLVDDCLQAEEGPVVSPVQLVDCLLSHAGLPPLVDDSVESILSSYDRLATYYDVPVLLLHNAVAAAYEDMSSNDDQGDFDVYVVYEELVNRVGGYAISPVMVVRSPLTASAYVIAREPELAQHDEDRFWHLNDIWYVRAKTDTTYPAGMHALPSEEVNTGPNVQDLVVQEDLVPGFVASVDIQRIPGQAAGDEYESSIEVLTRVGYSADGGAAHKVYGRFGRDYSEHEGLVNEDAVGIL